MLKLTLYLQLLVGEMRKVTQEQPEQFVEEMSKDHPMFKHMNNIIEIAQTAGTVQVPVRVAQLICNLLYTDTLNLKRLQIEAFVRLLQKLCEMSSTTNKEVVTWLMQQDDEVSLSLVFSGLI